MAGLAVVGVFLVLLRLGELSGVAMAESECRLSDLSLPVPGINFFAIYKKVKMGEKDHLLVQINHLRYISLQVNFQK